eukprot:14298675-Alexandrium_andersonii.AAC.1
MLSLGWWSEVAWEPGCVVTEALTPRGLSLIPPVFSDTMLVGVLALVILDAEHSRIAGATAALFRTLPMAECFQR